MNNQNDSSINTRISAENSLYCDEVLNYELYNSDKGVLSEQEGGEDEMSEMSESSAESSSRSNFTFNKTSQSIVTKKNLDESVRILYKIDYKKDIIRL
jgi:hypothetical protein